MFSAFQDTALNFSTHGISQTLLGYFGVDVGQIFSTYILVYALYQLGRDHYSWLYDYILYVSHTAIAYMFYLVNV
jgi:phosphotransferase system  glucose/maltose/N-acetylglucosamine-specific IIC component